MKAIVVTFHGPTSTRPSRLVAKADVLKSLTFSLTNAVSNEQAAVDAALALARRNDWKGSLVGGTLPDGRDVFVFVDETNTHKV